MCIIVKDVENTTNKRDIEKSVTEIEKRVKQKKALLPQDLYEKLLQFVDRGVIRPKLEVYVRDCETATRSGEYASCGGYCIFLRQRTFADQRLNGVLFHEMVHIAGGLELDAEFFENELFKTEEGARPPTDKDWKTFEKQKGQGWWVYLDFEKVKALARERARDLGVVDAAKIPIEDLWRRSDFWENISQFCCNVKVDDFV